VALKDNVRLAVVPMMNGASTAKPILDGDVVLHICEEGWAA
jgi:hypothetical protein